MCESYNLQYKRNYISLMPTNTFGPGDNYNLQNSFYSIDIKKIYLAKKIKKILLICGAQVSLKRSYSC